MSVIPLCCEPDPVLREKAQPVKRVNQEIKRLVRDMIDTMYANDGIGLAAPQVGRNLQLFVANPTQRKGEELVVLNPVMEKTRGRVSLVEGCLSLPNVWEKVRRADFVAMRGENLEGKPWSIESGGLLAIVLQHEFDHLRGQLFIDRLSWFARKRLSMRRARKAA